MKTRRASLEQMNGYTLVTLKRYSSRQRNWITFWRGEMHNGRALIIAREWEQDGNATGVL